jgi:hypothetical protein
MRKRVKFDWYQKKLTKEIKEMSIEEKTEYLRTIVPKAQKKKMVKQAD